MLGLTSVTFRNKSCEEIIALAKERGLECIEWGGDVHVPVNQLDHALKVGEMTRRAGLKVLSYGSYFRPGEGANFQDIINTALALGAKTVRVWTPWLDSERISDEDFFKMADELRSAAVLAEKAGLIVATEFHNGTYSDTAEHCLRLIKAVNRSNFKTYWQPLYGAERNLLDIAKLVDRIENVHVYNWIYGKEITRKLLSENEKDWEQYVKLLKDKNFLLEFVKEDSEENFEKDVICLKEIVRRVKNA